MDLKSTITEIKNSLEGLNRFDLVQERNSNLRRDRSNFRYNYSFQEIWKIEENAKGHHEHEIQNLQNDTGKTTNFFQLINTF